MPTTCAEFAREAIEDAKSAGEALLDEEGLLSDELQERLENFSKFYRLDAVYHIVITANGWDDSYAPHTTDPKNMLRQLAYACLIDEAKDQVKLLMIA